MKKTRIEIMNQMVRAINQAWTNEIMLDLDVNHTDVRVARIANITHEMISDCEIRFTKDVLEAYHHFLIYTRGEDCIKELYGTEKFGPSDMRNQHFMSKFLGYCKTYKNGTEAMFQFAQYYFVRGNIKVWSRILKYLKHYHWKMW